MGANRLASNSLIECLVFANRAVEDTVRVGAVTEAPEFEKLYSKNNDNISLYTDTRTRVAAIMNRHAGIIRSEQTLSEGLAMLEEIKKEVAAKAEGQHEYYIEASKRLICVAKLIMEPALMRKESRGGHYREDYPCSEEAFVLHSVQQRGKEISTAPVNAGYFEF